VNTSEPGETPQSSTAPKDAIDISDAGSVLTPKSNKPAQSKNNNRNRGQRRPGGSNTDGSSRSGGDSRRGNNHGGGNNRRRSSKRPHYTQQRTSFSKERNGEQKKLISRAPTENLRIIPLGGSGEIGAMNMLVFEYNNDIIVVDAGIKFPDADMPGIDYVIADTTYLEENKDRVRAFVVTHGHEDHIGGFPYIWPKFPVPIYTAPLTAGFIKSKFEEHGIEHAEFRIIQPGEKIQIGAFTVEPVQMTHSIPDILGLAFTTPVGLVYHATDWKIDFTPAFGKPTDFDKLAELSKRDVLCMLTDATGALQSGFTLSETVVSKAIEDVFQEVKGRLIVSSFSSRIDRMQHVVDACAKTSRKLFLSGRSMERNANIAMDLGYLKVPQGVLGDIRTINTLPDHKIVVMSTGSQGEEGSALARMAAGEHRHVRIKKGDTVMLSSSIVPGNEKAVDLTINNLYRAGAEVITNKELDIHSSGHGSRDEIKHMLEVVKPTYLIPIHGDYRRFVEMRKLAAELGIDEDHTLIIENGQVVEFDKDGKGKIAEERVYVGSVMIDGLGVGDVGEIVLRDRLTMAKDGVFLVILTVNNKTAKLVSSPDIISRGFVYMKESEDLIGGARALARKIHAQGTTGRQPSWDVIKKNLRDEITEYLYKKTQRSPMVISVVIQAS
jgi:ribonuclease J